MEIQRRVQVVGARTPVALEPRFIAWFRRATRPRLAYGWLVFVAAGYSVGVAYVLSLAHAQPMPEPYLRIPDSSYFLWGTLFYGPVIIAAWLLTASFMFLLAQIARGGPEFDGLMRGSALATAMGTSATLLPDLLTSPLRALGVINESAWESSVVHHGGWFFVLWAAMLLYVALFLVTYPIAVKLASHLTWWKSFLIGSVGFIVFQGLEFIFIR